MLFTVDLKDVIWMRLDGLVKRLRGHADKVWAAWQPAAA